jgi:hypothetical protein
MKISINTSAAFDRLIPPAAGGDTKTAGLSLTGKLKYATDP